MTKEHRISKHLRAKWYLEHVNTIMQFPDPEVRFMPRMVAKLHVKVWFLHLISLISMGMPCVVLFPVTFSYNLTDHTIQSSIKYQQTTSITTCMMWQVHPLSTLHSAFFGKLSMKIQSILCCQETFKPCPVVPVLTTQAVQNNSYH